MVKQVPKPFRHQIEANKQVSSLDFFALFCEQGTGKSRIAIDKASQLYRENKINAVIIISPNAVKEQWVKEQFELHFPLNNWDGYIWRGMTTKKEKHHFKTILGWKSSFHVFSFNVEAFQSNKVDQYIKKILEEKQVFVIIDESVKIKNGRRRVRGKRAGAKRTNKILDLFANVRYKCILSGTPVTKSPFDLWSQFEFLRTNFFGMDYFYFTRHYGILITQKTQEGKEYTKVLEEEDFNLIKRRINRQTKPTPDFIREIAYRYKMQVVDVIQISKMDKYSGYKNLDELKSKMSKVTVFLKKKDCLDLPPKIYETLYAEMTGEQGKIYKELKTNLCAEYAGKEINTINKMVATMRLQMIAGGLFPYEHNDVIITDDDIEFKQEYRTKEIAKSTKIKVLLDDLETQDDSVSKIIWACFRGEIDLIYDHLTKAGYSCEKFYGGSDYSIIEDFKQDKFKILITSPQKGGEGLNLQIATMHYRYSNPYRADLVMQAEDRSHRIGQTNKVLYKDIICKGTVDERIYKVLKRRKNLIDFFRNKNLEDFLDG